MKIAALAASVLLLAVQLSAQQVASPPIAVATHLLPDGSRSLLVDVRQLSQPVDEILIELPGAAAESAVLMSGPAGWTKVKQGNAARLSGDPASAPLRLRLSLFDLPELRTIRVRIRLKGRDVSDAKPFVSVLPPLQTSARPSLLLAFPGVISPGETIDLTVLNPTRTPADGQWVIDGVPAVASGPDRLRVKLPAELSPGSPLRISYFDAWGERLVDALAVDDTVVTATPPASGPRITGCARYGFIGETFCLCGNFPENSRTGIRIDGRPAVIMAASSRVLQVGLPAGTPPGPHVVAGDPALGFPASDSVSIIAVRVQASIDAQALIRGQSTTLRLGVEGVADAMTFTITNKTPGVVSLPRGNQLEIQTSGGTPNALEVRVNATGPGEFDIDYKVDGGACPCQDQAAPTFVSSASRPAPLFVPRRVLGTIAAGTPAAMIATAQAVAAANGVAVVEVVPLPAAGAGLAVFEITDGLAVPVKVAALAADPRIAAAQPDFVYDTSQASASASPSQVAYGLQMIGADVVQRVSRGEGILVGVIDAGIDTGHAALAKKVASQADVTGTGWTPDAHGTLVAGVIASEPDSNALYAGVAPGVGLVAVKSCVPLSSRQIAARCWSSTLARGIEAAASKNVRVINMSVGGPDDKLLARMVEAVNRRGIVVVSAAGNDGPSGKPSYPAGFDHVIAVTAVDAATHLYDRATRGAFITLAAPGVDVMSTGPGGRAQLFSGTSAATAFATGAIALLLRQRPTLSYTELSAVLRQTAHDLGAAGPDPEFGYGLLDVCRALARLSASSLPCH
jgi:hypothetical protein